MSQVHARSTQADTPTPIMRAMRVERANGPFVAVHLPRPRPGPGQVLVLVRTSGINPLDTKIRAGAAAHARHPLPAILGLDLAGEVVATGPGVTTWRPGDAVYGMTGGVGGLQGSLAEYAVADADLLAPKPRSLDMREAAALPLIAITAWEGLVDRARVAAGDRVLVLGGAGGVGHIVVQLARALGAEVHATGRPHQADTLRALGAVPHTDGGADVGTGYDVVYDTLGGPGLDAAFAAVRRRGHVVSCLGWGTHALAPLSFKAASYSGVFTLHPLLSGQDRAAHGAILRQVAALVDSGALRPRVDPRHFTLNEVETAHAALAGGAAGKLVVTVAD